MKFAGSPNRNRQDACRIRRWLVLGGCVCLLVMVLTHVAEHFHIWESMGWGLPGSPGHYLDLFSAITGVGLLLGAGISLLGTRNR